MRNCQCMYIVSDVLAKVQNALLRWLHDSATILIIKGVPLATEPGISLKILPLMRILQRNLKQTTDTFVFISYTTNVLLFQIRCNIFIVVRIIKEMPGSVASGTHCIYIASSFDWMNRTEYCERDSIGNV